MFLIELLLDFFVNGGIKYSYSYRFRTWPETLCQLINVVTVIEFGLNRNNVQAYNMIIKKFELIIFIRMLKLLTLLYEIKVMRIIIETMRNMVKPIMILFSLLMFVFYIFAMIGMLLFGGLIRKDLPIL